MSRNESHCIATIAKIISRKMSTINFKDKFQLPKRYQNNKPSVWNEYGVLNAAYKPINLGSGSFDGPAPACTKDALTDAVNSPIDSLHQYARGSGHPRLVNALSKLYSKLVGRTIDPLHEIIVTCGAYEALYTAIQGHIDEGDEVIVIEPFFDCYEPTLIASGGIARYIPLRLKGPSTDNITSGDYILDDAELEGLFNEKTKMIILNTPNNPLGKVFNREELVKIVDLCKKYNVLCVSDEVYEWMIYDGNEHVRICSLPGMWERTITIGSAGKTFSVTGWKTGWAYGPSYLLNNLQMVHQYALDSCATLIQEALAIAFEKELDRFDSSECHFRTLPMELKRKRDYMAAFLKSAGMKPVLPQGGFFMIADWSPLEKKTNLNIETDAAKDYRFTKWMIKNVGIQGVPPSAFFGENHKTLMENFVRYCFYKKDETLQKGAEVLAKWTSK